MKVLKQMILNGLDLQSITEFKSKKMLHKNRAIFTDSELQYSETKKNPQETLVGIFCCKEAFIKAVSGCLQIPKFNFTDIEVTHNRNGRPILNFHNEIRMFVADMQIQHDVSISHTADIVGANIVLLIRKLQ